MSELDPLDQQLSLAWRELSPPDSLEARVRERLVKGSGVSPGVRHPTKPASRARALRASGSLGASVGGALLALGFAAGYWSRPSSRVGEVAPPAAPVAVGVNAIAPEATQPPEAAAVEPPGSANDARDGSPRRARNPRTAPAPGPDTGGGLSLLARAERAVRAKNPQLALALIRSFDELRPSSALNEERAAIELMARCQAGDASASALGQRFAKRYPESVYVERIGGECVSPVAPLEQRAEPAPAMPSKPTSSPAPDINVEEGGHHAQPETQ